MERKEAIKRTAALLGGVVFAPSLLGVLKGCSPSPGSWSPLLFDSGQVALTKALSETIIPKTDTPGALDAGVPAFIEKMVADYYSEEQKQFFLSGMDSFQQQCMDDNGLPFEQLSEAEKHLYASEINRKAIAAEPLEGTPFFLMFKELVLIGFFTSEAGATQVLRYNPVPGAYRGCVPLEEIGGAWAT